LESREVTVVEGEKYASMENYKHFETSAYTGLNVRRLFEGVADAVDMEDTKAVQREVEQLTTEKNCC
jgi:hypothetical protein